MRADLFLPKADKERSTRKREGGKETLFLNRLRGQHLIDVIWTKTERFELLSEALCSLFASFTGLSLMLALISSVFLFHLQQMA